MQGLSRTPVDPLVHVSTSEPPIDARENSSNVPSGTKTEPEKSLSDAKGAARVEVDLFADPLGEAGAQSVPDKNRAPLTNLSEMPPKRMSSGNGNSEVFGAPQNDISKSKDIFEEPPKDGTSKTAPKPVGGKKAPSADLFGDDDDDDDGDDLFEEPLQAAVKKPQAKETNKASTDQSNNATSALFNEEVIRVPSSAAAKPSPETGSKTNGLHSDEDDLFTGILSSL